MIVLFSTIAYFPSVLYFCCFVSFCFLLTFDIFSGTHVRTCIQVATPLVAAPKRGNTVAETRFPQFFLVCERKKNLLRKHF